jgi:hypothetical protein
LKGSTHNKRLTKSKRRGEERRLKSRGQISKDMDARAGAGRSLWAQWEAREGSEQESDLFNLYVEKIPQSGSQVQPVHRAVSPSLELSLNIQVGCQQAL